MPYSVRKQGDQYCVYKKDSGKKVGCTDGTKEALRKYLGALYSNEQVSELKFTSYGVKPVLRAVLQNIQLLPKLGFQTFKQVLLFIKYGDIEEQNELEKRLKSLGVNVVYESKQTSKKKKIK